MNKVILEGRIANSTELRMTKNGVNVVNFSVAIQCGWGESAHPIFVECTAWRNQADFISKHFDKGDQIILVGSLDQNEYEKEGNKILKTYVQIEEVYFGAKKKVKEETQENVQVNHQEKKDGIRIGDEFISSDSLPFDDDNLPF